MSAMKDIYIDKVVVHMGVGESGERLVKAEDLVKKITGQKPVRTIAKRTQPAFGIRLQHVKLSDTVEVVRRVRAEKAAGRRAETLTGEEDAPGLGVREQNRHGR